MPHTTRKNAREWQRLWRGGEIITEIDGDDPGKLNCFNPRPRTGGDVPADFRRRVQVVSIRAPARGATASSCVIP